MANCLRCLIASALLAATCSPCMAKTFTSPTYGYSLDYPDSWEQIPSEDLAAATEGIVAGKDPAIYDAAFQPPDAPTTVDFPRIVVAVVPYTAIGFKRQLTESEIEEVSAKFAGLDPAAMKDVTDRKLTKDAADRIAVQDVGEFFLDMPNHRFIWSAEMIAGGEPVVCNFIMAFGNRHWVNASYWVRKSQMAGSEAIRKQFINSLRFTPANAYSVAQSNRNTPPPWWEKPLETGIAAAGAMLVIGIGQYVYHKFRGSSEPQTDTKQTPPPQPPKATTQPPPQTGIKVVCRQCNGRFRAPQSSAGKRTKCPKCAAPLLVPAE